jgi:hypothetical protein
MAGDAKPASKPIRKLLDAADLDLDAAQRLLVEPPNVLAANHLQQAAEKILSRCDFTAGCSTRETTTS